MKRIIFIVLISVLVIFSLCSESIETKGFSFYFIKQGVTRFSFSNDSLASPDLSENNGYEGNVETTINWDLYDQNTSLLLELESYENEDYNGGSGNFLLKGTTEIKDNGVTSYLVFSKGLNYKTTVHFNNNEGTDFVYDPGLKTPVSTSSIAFQIATTTNNTLPVHGSANLTFTLSIPDSENGNLIIPDNLKLTGRVFLVLINNN